MNTTFDVLVIILSVLLGIFLILAIVASLVVIKIVRTVKRVVEKGEKVIDSAEAATEMFKNAAGPLGAVKMVTGIIRTINNHKRGR